jgi:hypothetical protein
VAVNAGRAAHGTRRTSKPQQRRDDDRERKPGNAFITARKGFCYLTIKSFGRNHEMMRIRQYQIDAEEKRRMRRLYPDVAFDWTKITAQLAQKRDACRRYRARRRGRDKASHSRGSDAFHGVYDPATRTIYASRIPSTAAGVGTLLDAVLQMDRSSRDTPPPPEPVRKTTKPSLARVRNGNRPKP